MPRYRYGASNWADIKPQHKEEIWPQIESMQGARCAYCEGPMSSDGRHIEHFEPKSRNLRLTFAWPNLFGSCNQHDSCGHFKDSRGRLPPYDPADLIKPDIDNPEHYFLFTRTGRIE